MKLTISFKNLDHTPALDEKIKDKSDRLKKYLDGQTDIHWICSVDEGVHHADIKLNGPSFHCNSSAQAENLYKTLDLAVDKLEKQLQKKKEKWKNKVHGHTALHNLDWNKEDKKDDEDEY